MNVLPLLLKLEKLGLHIEVEDNQLKINAAEGILTPGLIDEIKDKKSEIIAFFKENLQKKVKYLSIGSSEKKSYYLLSSAQKRIYILQRMEEKNISYNMPYVLSVKGNADAERMTETFKKLIARHESLRTSFITADNEPVQYIHDEVEFKIEYYESKAGVDSLSAGSSGSTREVIGNFIRPFDLSSAPLLRAGLIKEEDGTYILALDMHHIIGDGTSQTILAREFIHLYNGGELPPLNLQYKDYSEWQNNRTVPPGIKKAEEYWMQEFAGEVPILNLPYDYPRPAVQSFEGSGIVFGLNIEETRELNNLAQSQRVTLFMLFLAIYNIFLAKISNQGDIVVGTPIAGREHIDLESIIGMFVNTLALRNYPSGEETFAAFLEEVKKRTIEAFENQDFPFEELVKKVSVARDMSRNPIFDSMFVFQSALSPAEKDSGSEIKNVFIQPYGYDFKIAKFDLSFTVVERRETLYCEFEYSTKLFQEETIRRFITYFKNITANVRRDPGKKIWELEIITEEEKKRFLYDFNDTEVGYPKDKTIPGIFTSQVAKTPGHIAIIGLSLRPLRVLKIKSSTVQISYSELNEKSNRLANLLKAKGVATETIVGVMAEHSIELIIGILGILKVGGVYLPIDPGCPGNRIKFICHDSVPAFLLSLEKNERIFAFEGEIIQIDNTNRYNYPGEAENPGELSIPANLAYIIYTSGTTGRPKGVMVEQRNLVAYIYAFYNEFHLSSYDVFIQQTAAIFDVFIEEVFTILLSGGKLAIPQRNEILDIDQLSKFINRYQVTVISCSPLLLNELNRLRTIHSIRLYISGGDILKNSYTDNLKRTGTVYNAYGPTEATIGATYFRCPGTVSPVPIGKPIANYKIYILNKYNRLQPIGIPGELCISGAGVVRGYLNQPELTAEKFFFATFPCFLLYCTGDLARWLPDGNIEFLGRIDTQLKIRGYRIESGEIENRLLKHKAIKDAVVLIKESAETAGNTDGNKYLCAYIVAGKEFNVSELRGFLAKELPDYMIPSSFVKIDKIPLTPGGKINSRALEFSGKAIGIGIEYVPPGTKMEKLVASIWMETLKLDKMGIDDNFFDLGGNSLDIIKVNNRLREETGKNIPVVKMFTFPTIRSLSTYLIKEEGDRIPVEMIDDAVNLAAEAMQMMYAGEEYE